ncbi:NAD-P-binding protein [Stereum hirsutum FP-91666 SS1]|uniref:NAD-P-binding protein n=1 Tax=Stereum hirsutum (strain FP-91666) TaxID=721885 RepID=UPI00044494CF|nr:NAD-P-binding protein [Stereum hirsutum FP-91666 SS1]EIM81791.1 NAD-P-binding protein [Stereum hirsutum FP-91666 SS1]
MDLDLKSVHVLITGAAGGIGLETTRLFLGKVSTLPGLTYPRCEEQGALVTAHYRSSDASLLPLLETYGSKQLRLAQAELTSEDQVNALFGQNLDEDPFGSVEVIVVNHGAHAPTAVPVKDMSLAQWEHCVNSNLTSTFLVVREYLNALENVIQSKKVGSRFGDRASVVFVGSTAGKFGEAGFADYASNKSGMMYGLALSLKNEIVKIAPRGRVNTVAPGWTRTPLSADRLKDTAKVNRVLATIPLRKVATTEDIASQIVLLASAKVSGHVSGQVLMVDGGMEGRLLNLPEDL